MKKILGFIFTVSILFAIFSYCGINANAATSEYYTYSVSNGKAKITDCDTSISGDVVIPKMLGGYPVTSIGDYAFYECETLESITIPEGVTSIGTNAFKNCKSLKSIELPQGITQIDYNTFLGCASLESVSIPNSVKNIKYLAFCGCNSLETITIPKGVTRIGSSVFDSCENLKKITVDKENKYFTSLDGVLFNKNKTKLLCYPGGKEETSYKIPNGVTKIDPFTFRDLTKLESITIPNSVKYIGSYAFEGCTSLKNITIPKSVKSIGNSAFSSCTSLKSIIISDGVTSIGDEVFYSCTSLKNIVIPDSVESIGESAFEDCSNLESIVLPFVGKSRDAKNDYDAVFGYIFGYIEVEYFEDFPDNCDAVLQYIKHSVNLDEGSTEYYYYLLKNLKSVVITDATHISKYAFKNCDSIINITLPKTLKTIEDSAFDNCKSLNNVYYLGTKSKKSKISIGKNDCLTNAKWYYNTCYGSTSHKYDNDCDKNCNVCDKERSVKDHIYKEVITKATLKKNGEINYKCSNCGYKVNVKAVIKRVKSTSLSTKVYTYNGKTKTPKVVVKDMDGRTLKKNTDYTVKYLTNRKTVGVHKVKITFKGKYSGSKTLSFTIKPVATKVSKVTAGKKNLTVAIKKQTKQVTGYQIQYSTNKKFTSAKTKTISSYKTTKTTIKGLKHKKTYYVRVRTYKTVNGKKYYSAWSKYKTQKTK